MAHQIKAWNLLLQEKMFDNILVPAQGLKKAIFYGISQGIFRGISQAIS